MRDQDRKLDDLRRQKRIKSKKAYVVRVHFSRTSREIMRDKIKRMLKNEIRQMGS